MVCVNFNFRNHDTQSKFLLNSNCATKPKRMKIIVPKSNKICNNCANTNVIQTITFIFVEGQYASKETSHVDKKRGKNV